MSDFVRRFLLAACYDACLRAGRGELDEERANVAYRFLCMFGY